jgi:hypothetical protein
MNTPVRAHAPTKKTNPLSNYCAYLVVFVPELLAGLVLDTTRAYDHFAEAARVCARYTPWTSPGHNMYDHYRSDTRSLG